MGEKSSDLGTEFSRKGGVCEFTQFEPLEPRYEQSAQMDWIKKSLDSPSTGPDFRSCTSAHMHVIMQLVRPAVRSQSPQVPRASAWCNREAMFWLRAPLTSCTPPQMRQTRQAHAKS